MRGVLMTLGVVLHSAQIFSPGKSWLLYSQHSLDYTQWIIQIVHTFRMPAFFIVSGFFCALTLGRYGASTFLRVRLMRILVPFLFVVLTLNVYQAYFLANYNGVPFDVAYFLNGGLWASHLWFLMNIMVYFVVAAGMSLLIAPQSSVVGGLVSQLARVPVVLQLLLLPCVHLLIQLLGKLGLPIYGVFFGSVSWYTVLDYFPFFVYGMVLLRSQDLLNRFCTISPLILLVVMAVGILAGVFFTQDSSLLHSSVSQYGKYLVAWSASALCFYVFRRFMSHASKVSFFISDASYTVYLVHHLLVVLIGAAAIGLGWGGGIVFVAIMLAVLGASLVIHQYGVKKSRILEFLLNGKITHQ